MLAQTLEPDRARSLALYRHIETALQEHGSSQLQIGVEVRERIEALEQALTADEKRRADDIAHTEIARWRAPTVRGADSLDTSGRQRDIHRAWCAR